MSFDWKSMVRTIAPVIGGAVGGPFGGAAMSALSNALLGKSESTENEISQALEKATPEQLANLRKIDNDFEVKMAELGFKVEELHATDRQGARGLFEINIWPQMVLSAFYTIGYFTVLILLMNGKITLSSDIQPTFNIILGVLTGAIPMILQFWFGSSTGSKEKTAKLTHE